MAETNVVFHAEIQGVEEATDKAMELQKKINEAKTLAGELASMLEKLEVKI